MSNSYSYPYNIPPTIYQQNNQRQRRRKSRNNDYDSEEDSSDVVYLGHSGPIQQVLSNEKVNNMYNSESNQPDVEITNNFDEKLLFEIEKVVYNPEKLHSILSRLNGVNPNDPIFSEFYNNDNHSKS